MRHQIKSPANPGASATALIFDDMPTSGELAALTVLPLSGMPPLTNHRITFMAYLDVGTATYYHYWYAPGSTNARVVNGGGAGELIGATTPFERDVRLYPGRNRLVITTAVAPAPATWEIAVERIDDQSLAQ